MAEEQWKDATNSSENFLLRELDQIVDRFSGKQLLFCFMVFYQGGFGSLEMPTVQQWHSHTCSGV